MSVVRLFDRIGKIVQTLPADRRREEEEHVAMIQQAGVDSLKKLLEIVREQAAPPSVRIAACSLLGLLRDGNATKVLVTAFQETEDTSVMWEAAKALSQVGRKKATKSLVAALLKAPKPAKRSAAAWALGRLGDRSAVQPLLETVMNRTLEPDIRGHAAEALGMLRAREAVENLIGALSDPSAEVRFWAAYALGEIGDPRALPELRRVSDSDDAALPNWGKIRDEARRAIELIQGRSTSSE